MILTSITNLNEIEEMRAILEDEKQGVLAEIKMIDEMLKEIRMLNQTEQLLGALKMII